MCVLFYLDADVIGRPAMSERHGDSLIHLNASNNMNTPDGLTHRTLRNLTKRTHDPEALINQS
jgi:hypothetical protein